MFIGTQCDLWGRPDGTGHEKISRGNFPRLQTVEKVSLCWAFSIFYDIIIMGDEKCLNEEKWSVEFMKL